MQLRELPQTYIDLVIGGVSLGPGRLFSDAIIYCALTATPSVVGTKVAIERIDPSRQSRRHRTCPLTS
ncbi:hypothetical protein [Henriciella aquimarina]|uniref:hypothetical protein n=1 Tax=Henriciella aquimarina TaxID=545261 RepID=UPI00117BC411|nr:hypothetical protein [Henriciella aquimarina]